MRDCLHSKKDAHAVICAELDLYRARVLKLEAMLCNCGRRAGKGESKATNVEAAGNLNEDTTTQVDNVGPNGGKIYDNVIGADSTVRVCETGVHVDGNDNGTTTTKAKYAPVPALSTHEFA